MEENVKVGTYKEKEVKVFLKKAIILGSILLVVIIFIFIKACTRKTFEDKLLISAKQYFEKFSSVLPKEAGECTYVTANEMISKQTIEDAQQYNSCDRDKTLVKVCKLENGEYHYNPIIECGNDDDTLYEEFKKGKESDIIPDKTDLRYTYLPLIYTNRIKQYYPNNSQIYNDSKEYYLDSPNEEYFYRDETGVTGYKWYSKDTGTNYWNDGQYTSEKPSGYDSQGEEGTPVVKTSLDKPDERSYRTIKETTLYRTKEIKKAYIHSYACVDPELLGQISSTVKCENRNSTTYKVTIGIYYTCDGKTTVTQNTVCSSSADWSNYTTNQCTKTQTQDCESTKGYVYTDKVWKWYVSGDYRKYYPSGNASEEEEKTYYTESPSEGYIKDEETKKTVYKYFKLSEETGETESWVQIGNKYMDIEELNETFLKYGFEVKSLNDIKTNKNTDIKLKLEIRNRR